MIDLTDKVALITGGSRGIGAATALLFARAGCNVAVNYRRDQGAAEKVVAECSALGVQAQPVAADVSVRAQVDEMVFKAISEFGQLDILVNNAGIWKEAAIDRMTEEELVETLDANLKSMFFCCSAAAKQMIEQKSGVIINIASTAGQRGEALHSHYAASKSGAIGLTKSLAPELAPHNIRVNCVAPGWVETDMSRDALTSSERSKILSVIPLRRAGTSEELAGPILFLASNLATFITGEVLNVNGGAVLCG